MERKKKDKNIVDLIIKIVIIILLILLLIQNCVFTKNRKCNNNSNLIDIDCKNDKCNAILKDLIVSPINIDFKSNIYVYDIEVDSNVEELIINAMPFDPSTKVKIPNDLSLKEGLNVFKVTATTKNGKTKTYTIYVTKKDNNNKIIKNILVSPKNINFSEDNYRYTINVAKNVSEIQINVIPYDSSTEIEIPNNLSLKYGINTFEVRVTTKDGKVIKYIIIVNREKENNNGPILKELTTSPTPIYFKENQYTYNIEVDSDVNEIVINALPYSSDTKVIIPSDLSLQEGLNVFEVEVITSDGRRVKYIINVIKKGTNSKVIKDINVGEAELNFNEDTYTYEVEVSEDTEEITLDVLTFDENTIVTITPSDLSLQEGLNTFKIEATNKDGITKVYTINVIRHGNTKVLRDIIVGPEDIDFEEDVYTYDIKLESDVEEISLDALAFSSDTTVVITPSDLSLQEGLNTFKVEATNKSGVKKVYTINVIRKYSESNLFVRDKNIQWSQATSVEIFENPLYDRGIIIAPESSNTYQFEVKNSTNYTLKYEIDFSETNLHNINMKYKLKKNDTYLIDDYVSASELRMSNILLETTKSDIYYLEWKWISSDNDTEIGKTPGADYSLQIDVKAESIDD